MSKTISGINQLVWSQKNSALEYARESLPFPPEAEVIIRFKKELMEAVVLDIGIGAGRTTNFLSLACSDYVGIDYSREMVAVAKDKFPDLKIYPMDARNLAGFTDRSFDMVWFSYNGLDYVSHDDRLIILSEVGRVLKKNGIFVFSSHNRDVKICPAWHVKNIKFSLNPLRLAKNLGKYFINIFHSTKLASHEIETNDYAILNDQAQGYKLLTYYISLSKQLEQLQQAGFAIEFCLGVEGDVLEKDIPYLDGYSIYYVARRCL